MACAFSAILLSGSFISAIFARTAPSSFPFPAFLSSRVSFIADISSLLSPPEPEPFACRLAIVRPRRPLPYDACAPASFGGRMGTVGHATKGTMASCRPKAPSLCSVTPQGQARPNRVPALEGLSSHPDGVGEAFEVRVPCEDLAVVLHRDRQDDGVEQAGLS